MKLLCSIFEHMAYLNKFNLRDKNILITGAAGLLGYEHSVSLLETGARVFITDINYAKLKKIKSQLIRKNYQYQIDCFEMDVSKESSILKVLKKINET